MSVSGYIHGYSERETERLRDQAETLAGILHCDTSFPPGSLVLEAGCGTGAQTVFIAGNSPAARITAVDISKESLAQAEERVRQAGITNVEFRQADIFDLPFQKGCFDHVFVCFVLEHLARPIDALVNLGKLIRPGGTLTVIEGDHGSAYFYPDSEAAKKAIACQIALQAAAGGNALIGRELYPLLKKAGFKNVHVSPRMVYVDSGKPDLVEGFTKNTFTAMVEGIRDKALRAGMIDQDTFDQGIRDLERTAGQDGVFCYTFFKAICEPA
ncbi:MAG TPA: methyltransferase domain-containing protein [Deltaproteobacteria bacterium]|nr:methyltransferase domain-containing protein [Deltaproteobacteria bacterium]HQI02833.1 methyltransferase domain-containing protein [Deltaproteobacteria bacterium]HQJ08086.1 methyltransferase domain-containing protein [Deltaproteobacteria bacterium]